MTTLRCLGGFTQSVGHDVRTVLASRCHPLSARAEGREEAVAKSELEKPVREKVLGVVVKHAMAVEKIVGAMK